MKLTDFANMIYTDEDYTTLFVFDDNDMRDEYRKSDDKDGLLFSVQTSYKLNYVLKGRWANAEVVCFYPVASGIVDVIIETAGDT